MAAVWHLPHELETADWYVPPSPARSPRPRAATYRRRRLVLAVVALVVASLGWRLSSGLTAGARGQSVPPAQAPSSSSSSYVIQPGDTLWSVAERVAGERDVRAVVAELIALNGGETLSVGQPLTLPAARDG